MIFKFVILAYIFIQTYKFHSIFAPPEIVCPETQLQVCQTYIADSYCLYFTL